ncbi:helix-turn-helix domain-containing protein [Pseudomonas fragi]|uniref:Helix-turn-helix domain-containing protein n=1 Tax=Pseudomonas fragi TaxID=296 RepID=A0A266LMS9_PSEFR|nr:helix-turn-helix domain-containing protein [Pseudomonas fragi]OZY39366.1 helix-turn-helix domain-containing protein [Pseudomonas fragi]
MAWALALPKQVLENPSARHVLLCLANYAGSDGRGAFPSAKTLSEDTGLGERTVRLKLDELEQSGFILRGNQAIAAAYIDRRDRRPVVYDLQIKRGASAAPRNERDADNDRAGCSSLQNGVQEKAERGAAAAPNTLLNHQLTEEQLQVELAGVIAEQDQQALDAADDRQRFAMFAKWEPAAKAIADQLAIAGLPSDSLTDEVISGFKGFHVAKPSTVDSAAGWCFRLATWIKRERVKTTSAVVQAGVSGFDDDDTSWINGGAK